MIENRMTVYNEPRLSYLQYMELQADKRKREAMTYVERHEANRRQKKEPAIKPIDFIEGRHINAKR